MEEEQHILKSLASNYKQGKSLAGIERFINQDFSNVDAHPTGVVTVHPIDAEIHPDSISNDMFHYIVVCKVHDPDKKLTDNDFAQKEQELNTQVPQYSKTPPRLADIKPERGEDLAPWTAELGPDGLAGVYKEISGRDTSYYIVVQASLPDVCKEYKHKTFVGMKAAPSFQQVCDDPSYNYARDLAKRNAERLAYCAADAFGVKINQVVDGSAKVEASFYGKPWRGLPDSGLAQALGQIHEIDSEHVGVFHRVCPASQVQDECLVACGPYEGVTLFSMNNTRVRGVGLPIHTGKGRGQKISEKERERRARGFVSEGDVKARLSPETHASVDDDFLKAMAKLGWRQKGANNRRSLVPVVVKVSDPEIKRK